jgi:hypothetical protein
LREFNTPSIHQKQPPPNTAIAMRGRVVFASSIPA